MVDRATDNAAAPAAAKRNHATQFDVGRSGKHATGDTAARTRRTQTAAANHRATPQPTSEPTKIGNLKGLIKIDASGEYVGLHVHGPMQGGFQAVDADAYVWWSDGVCEGASACWVFPALPWSIDFTRKLPVGKPPLTWIGVGGKFAVQGISMIEMS